jgi:DNA polymerase-3 subunit epsilon
MPPLKPLRVALDRRRHKAGPWAFLFESYSGEEVVSLDCETTGPDPATAGLLSVAAVPVRGQRILTSEALDMKARPESAIEHDAIRVHRLRKQDLAGGHSVDEVLESVLKFVGNRPILGYNIRFDAAVLDRHLKPRLGFRLPNKRLELSDVYMSRCRPGEGQEADLRLETIARSVGLPPPRGRHDALTDAVFVAAVYVRLKHGKRPA